MIAIGATLGGLALAGCCVGIWIAVCKTTARRRRRREITLSLLPLRSPSSQTPFTVAARVPALSPRLQSVPRFLVNEHLPPIRSTHIVEY